MRTTHDPRWSRLRLFLISAVSVLCVGGLGAAAVTHYASAGSGSNQVLQPVPSPASAGLPTLGVDYYAPNSYGSACPNWTWLETRCFRPSPPRSGGDPGYYVLNSDLSFARTESLGGLFRVWLSADQLIRWSAFHHFLGLRAARLRNLDQALAIFAKDGFKVDIVVFSYSSGTRATNQFHPEALDGRHLSLRDGYLEALSAIIRHLTADSTDRDVVKVVDLENEAYFQLEQYFTQPGHLGRWVQCLQGSGRVSSPCVDQMIVHPWLSALYRTARQASHDFLYTVSDTGRLLTTNSADQRYWMGMYPVDIYDIHLYDSTPWTERTRWATALNLRKAWFSGEVGCASGDTGCTYNGAAAARIDHWWLITMPVEYRAESMLIESAYPTVWTYRARVPSQTLTQTGIALQCAGARAEKVSCPSFG